MDNGDTRRFYEENPPTFSIEDTLPSLPLPSLKSTLQRYLDSVKPFVNDQEYLKTQKIAEDFENGIGARVQSILSEKEKYEKNWVCLNKMFKA